MSFILDALKKLDQKRQQGSVPDLMTVHTTTPQEPKKRSRWPYLIVIALLLNAGVLTALLRPWESEETVVAQAQKKATTAVESEHKDTFTNEPISAAPQVIKETPEEETSAVTDKEPAPDSEPPNAKVDKDTIEKKSQDSLLQSEPDKIEASPTVENKDTNEDSLTDNTTESLDLNPSAGEIEVLRKKIKEELSSTDDHTMPESQPSEDIETEPETNVLELSQLPSEIKKKLPDMSISGHIYSNNPGSRIVNINGYIIREGENVIDGLKVEEITMSGVILNYQGFRFRMRAF
jgi:general secretion pathway protein B